MLEVEYKAHVDDLEAIRGRLEQQGAVLVGEQREVDHYYAHPIRSFQETDEALRVRTRTTSGSSDATATPRILTYKGRRHEGPTRSREEVEVTFDGDLERILEALSFTLAGRVAKHRRLYRYGDLIVTLDEVEGLGTFVEVEATAADTRELETARDRVLALVERLALGQEETRSYLEMVLAQGTDSSSVAPSRDR